MRESIFQQEIVHLNTTEDELWFYTSLKGGINPLLFEIGKHLPTDPRVISMPARYLRRFCAAVFDLILISAITTEAVLIFQNRIRVW